MAKKDGGPAFPQIETDAEEYHHTGRPWGRTYSYGGMTLRDYFAAKALNGFLSDAQSLAALRQEWKGNIAERLSLACYEWADAMLKARSVSDEGEA